VIVTWKPAGGYKYIICGKTIPPAPKLSSRSGLKLPDCSLIKPTKPIKPIKPIKPAKTFQIADSLGWLEVVTFTSFPERQRIEVG